MEASLQETATKEKTHQKGQGEREKAENQET